MEKKFFASKEVTASPEVLKGFLLEYYIIEEEMEYNNIVIKTYGIEIIKKMEIDGVWNCEIKTVRDITPSYKDVCNMVQIFSENYITPVHLQYVLDDLVGVR